MEMGNTSTYNREYYWKNRERINENAKRRRANMTAEQREKYLNRMKECYKKNHGYYVSRKQLLEENKKLKEELRMLKEGATLYREDNKKLRERIDELEKCNLNLQERLDRKEELNKSYRKVIKDHQLYEEKLEHRIIEFEELLHGD